MKNVDKMSIPLKTENQVIGYVFIEINYWKSGEYFFDVNRIFGKKENL